VTIVLVRHAGVEADPDVPPALWPLSDEGRWAARHLARERLWRPIERIFCSPETKSLETAHIIAGPNGMTVTAVEALHEVVRPAHQWFGEDYPGGYPGAVREYLTSTDPVHGWEPRAAAQDRIVRCIDELRRWEPNGFAVSGHGLTLSLYVSSVLGVTAWEIWPSIALPDYAVLDQHARRLLHPFGRWRPASIDG
jgi:broad specificity phosphatase PhoE